MSRAQHCSIGRLAFASLSRRLALVAAAGLAVLAARRAPAAEDAAARQVGLDKAYAEYLYATKGILDIRTFHQSALGSKAVEVVVVSAGFKAAEMGEFHKACEALVKSLFTVEPWIRLRSAVRVHAVFVDDESVAKSRVGVGGYDGHVLGCDNGAAVEYARYAANADAVIVLHNSGYSTAGTGVWGVVTINKGDAYSAGAPVHELGHGMAGLGDEYIQRSGPFDEPPESLLDTVNVTPEPNPRLCKWHRWTEDEWPGLFRTLKHPQGRLIANFEGAGWPKKIYRPEEACMMRCCSDYFCLVCNETMEANMFRYMDLFDTVEPAQDDLVLWKGESADFRVCANGFIREPHPWLTSRLDLYVDGKRVGRSEHGEVSFHFGGANTTPGVHQVGAKLTLESDAVWRDFGLMSGSRGWRVRVMSEPRPAAAGEAPRVTAAAGGAGATVRAEAAEPVDLVTGQRAVIPLKAVASEGGPLQLVPVDVPAGATLNRETGELAWTPGVDDAGPRLVRVLVQSGSASAEIAQLFRVRRAATPSPVSYCNSYIPDTLKHLEQLKTSPQVYQRLFETLRLLRDRYGRVYEPALAAAEELYPALPPELRVNCLEDLSLHTWAFQDKPAILAWMRRIAGGEPPDVARELIAKLDRIDGMNSLRKTETEGGLADLEPLMAKLVETSDGMISGAIVRAVGAICGRVEDKDACLQAIRGAMEKAQGGKRVTLVPLLPLVRTPGAMSALAAAAGDPDPAVALKAVGALEKAGGIDELAPVASMLARSREATMRSALLQAGESICGRTADKAACQGAILPLLASAKGPGLAALLRLMPRVNTPAAMEVWTRAAGDADKDVSAAARESLDYLKGIGTTDAFVASWQVSGPYCATNGEGPFEAVFAPEKAGGNAEWRHCAAKRSNGIFAVSLGSIFGGDDRAAYMKAVLRSDKAQEILFEAGSDDGMKVWLNGREIHARNTIRPMRPGDDKFVGRLEKGDNVLLCKIVQGGGEWGACLRVRAADGGDALGVSVADEAEPNR